MMILEKFINNLLDRASHYQLFAKLYFALFPKAYCEMIETENALVDIKNLFWAGARSQAYEKLEKFIVAKQAKKQPANRIFGFLTDDAKRAIQEIVKFTGVK